ncbi:MAG TPA: hypothetical protein VK770_14955 [Candidatus Acidoferrum sp.]|nr:hypothetical protein [Candidatus Acidoferrum sp.]
MRNHSILSGFAVAALALPLILFAQPAQHSAAAKMRAASNPPDFSGVWFVDEYRRNILPNEDPPFQPWAEALFQKRVYENTHRAPDTGPDPTERCIPPGIPRTMGQPFPWEIVQTRDRVIMIFEYQSLIRQIFTDGRGHPKDLDPTYMGNAIGKFEGDTLVIDTIGFNDKTWLDPMGLPHSDAMHVIERLRRMDHDTLVDEYTIDDPKAYTKSWTAQRTFKLKPDWQIQEYVCAENNNIK